MNKYYVVDLETTSKSVYDRTANPWFNKVVAVGYVDETKQPKAAYFTNTPFDVDTILTANKLIAHNAKFESLYFFQNQQFHEWITKGGTIYCTQLAEYYITDYQTKICALRDIAVNIYNCPSRTKHLEDLLFANSNSQYTDVDELPSNLVLEDVKNDVLDTQSIYEQQQAKINRKGKAFKNLLDVQMECLLATAEMEYNGMYIDINILQQDRLDTEKKIKEKEAEIIAIANKYWKYLDNRLPEFNYNSKDHLSVLLFGGNIKVDTVVPVKNADGTVAVFKTGKNAGQIKTKKTQISVPIKGMGLQPKADWVTLKEGIYQTNEAVLESIYNDTRLQTSIKINS